MLRRAPVALALSFLAACDSANVPTAPEPIGPSAILIDGTSMGNSFFFFLPPVVNDNPAIRTVADASLRPRLEICEWSFAGGGDCVPSGAAFTYTTTSGPNGEVVNVSDAHYSVNWDTGLPGVAIGKVFRARVFIVDFELGSVDFEIAATGRDVKNINTGENIGLVDGRRLPIRFRIEEGAIDEAETQAEALCFDTFGNVIDCDVEVIEAEEGGIVTVSQDPGGEGETLAAIIAIEPNDAVDAEGDPVSDFTLTLQHVPQGPSSDLVPEQQIPFFIDVAALDAAGSPVFFQQGALIVLCQPPDLGDSEASLFVPDELHHSLKLFAVRDGVTEILETGIDDDNCPGGLHGGLNTVSTRFSGFGATLPTDPSQSTAVVPDGTVGAPTVIEIQAEVAVDEGSLPQIFGGDSVAVTVTGANPGTPAAIDNGDGTYTAQYTPTAAGVDTIAIGIRNVETGTVEPISGSPFISIVTAPAPDLVVSSVGPVSLDGLSASVTYTVSNLGGPAADFPDNSTFDVAVYLSTDDVLDEGDVQLTSMYSAWSYAVGTGWSESLSESGTLPSGTPDGEYHLIVVADAFPGLEPNNYPGVQESDETNNWTASPPFTLGSGVTIDDVILASTTLVIEGPNVSYTATVTNNTGGTLSVVVFQGWIDQGSASRAAGGLQVLCGAGTGELPPGTCTFGFSVGANNTTSAGSGTLEPGAATARLVLLDDGIELDTFTVPITLIEEE